MNKSKTTQLTLEDKPVFSFWEALYQSFYSKKLYVDVAKRWKGFGMLYVLFLIALLCIPVAGRIMWDFNYFFTEQVIYPFEQLPPLYVQKGQITLDKPMPYKIKNREGKVVAIIDTTGEINKIDKEYPYLNLLVTKDKILFRPPQLNLFFKRERAQVPQKIEIHSLNKNDNEVFVGKE